MIDGVYASVDTVSRFRQKFTLEDAIGATPAEALHACDPMACLSGVHSYQLAL
jgi:hypothetical protein